MQHWYAHAASELEAEKTCLGPQYAIEVDRFLTDFHITTGFDFHAEASGLTTLVRRVLSR